MRTQITALVTGVLGALGGGWLVGVWCFGLVLIVLSAGVIVWGLLHDDGKAAAVSDPQVYAFPRAGSSLQDVLERARAS